MKTGILFSGQGAQYPGMGRSFYEESAAARAVFDAAGDDLTHLIFEGTQDELSRTDVTQPAVYTVGMAAWAALSEAAEGAGAEPLPAKIAFAGFSLGEYGALTASGVVKDFACGLDIVRHRGVFMAEAGKHEDGSPRGAMAAVIGEREATLSAIDEVRMGDVLEAVNFNAPTQISAAGDAEAIARLKAASRERGLRVIPLKVSTAFHSPIMNPASERLYSCLSGLEFDTPTVSIYVNTTGRELCVDADTDVNEYVRTHMAAQLKSPVLWQNTIENMLADGIDAFIETGPGKTLCGLVSKISPDTPAVSIDADGIEAALALLSGRG